MKNLRWVLALGAAAVMAGCNRGEAARSEPAAVVKKVGALTFHEDEYPQALAEAKRRGVPLFVDAWAPWCHTCLSLQEYVLADAAMAPLADRFVWLAIDTEREKNAAFLKKFPVEAWPTLWVIDPRDERPVVRWPGSLNGGELRDLLDDAAQAIKGGAGGGEASAALLLAERALAEGKAEEAIVKFRTSLEKAPGGWGRRPRATDGLVTALYGAKQHEECARVARESAGQVGAGTSAANVALYGLMCAHKLSDKAASEAAAATLEKIARDPAQTLLADDRSSLFEELMSVRREQGDKEGARRVATEWLAFLDAQVAKAATPEARRVFDAHRMLAYLELGAYDKAMSMVEQSEREQPGDYNHAARVAKIHLEAGRPDEALKAIDRSLGLAYGPRRLRLLDLKARILEKKGDAAGSRAAREQGVREGEAMKLEGKQARALDDLRAKLKK